jgi:hypothetical protein
MDSAGERCSIFLMWKIPPLLLLFAVPAFGQETGTAYEALRAIGTQLNREYINHIISVTGTNGRPQPESWKILIEDPRSRDGVREVEVRDGQIESQRTSSRSVVGSTQGAAVDTRRLNLDSSGAYAVASHTADKSHAAFSTVSYTLRTNERGDPVWIVTLHKQSGRPVGTIYIGAARGNVTRTEGLFSGASMEDVETERDLESEGDDVRGMFDNAKGRISHAFYVAQEEARAMFERVRRSFSDFINQ